LVVGGGVVLVTRQGGSQMAASSPASLSASVTVQGHTLTLHGYASAGRPVCAVRANPAGQAEFTVTAVSRAPASDRVLVTITGYHGDGVYPVPAATGTTSVAISRTGPALAAALQSDGAVNPTVGFQVGGTIQVSDGGRSVSFSGGDSLAFSQSVPTGTMRGQVTC